MASAWLWALPALGAAQLALTVANLARFQRPRVGEAEGAVAALVPARDEAARIGPLVSALLADPAVSRVRVLDDHSTEGTADVARAAAGGDPRFEQIVSSLAPK